MSGKESLSDQQVQNEDTVDLSHLAGKYLTFHIAKEEYGIEILKVKEIIGVMTITRIPRTPDYIRGVINLRGKVIPVMEMRCKFELEAREDTSETCIIVVDVRHEGRSMMMGILVDSVSEVVNIASSEIEKAPYMGGGVDTRFILGMGKTKDHVVILLDIDKILTDRDIEVMEEANQ